MTRTRLRPRCTAIASDKKQCGKRCHDNESPALCHVHRALANGGTIGTPFVSTKTPMERIEKIAGKDGHPHQMQALKILLEEAATKSGTSADDHAWVAFKLACTLDEVSALNGLANQMRLIKARIYQRCPEARPASYIAPTQVGTNDYAPGTFYLHPDAQCVVEAVAIDVPEVSVAPPTVVAEDDDLEDGEEEL